MRPKLMRQYQQNRRVRDKQARAGNVRASSKREAKKGNGSFFVLMLRPFCYISRFGPANLHVVKAIGKVVLYIFRQNP